MNWHQNLSIFGATGVGGKEVEAAAAQALALLPKPDAAEGVKPLVAWQTWEQGGLELLHSHPIKSISWHGAGTYFASVAPTGVSQVGLSSLLKLCPQTLFSNPISKP